MAVWDEEKFRMKRSFERRKVLNEEKSQMCGRFLGDREYEKTIDVLFSSEVVCEGLK